MKIRNSFISNSSSSSFICTIAVVEDEEKLKQFENKINYIMKRLNHKEMLESLEHCGDFQDSLYGAEFEEYKDKTFIVDTECGEWELYEEDEDGELIERDYDQVDISDFSNSSQRIAYAGNEEGLNQIFCTYYAGYNG